MKRFLLLIACAAAWAFAHAGHYRTSGGEITHGFRCSLGAAECNTFTRQGDDASVPVSDLPGLGLQTGVGYELSCNHLLFGLDLFIGYSRTGQRADYRGDVRSGYLDRALGADGSQTPVSYHYIFESYSERQNRLEGGIQLYLGATFGRSMYALGGVKLSSMLCAGYRTGITLSTRKIYSDILLPEVVEASDADGNYASHRVTPAPGGRYGWSGPSADPLRLQLAPVAEIGFRARVYSMGRQCELRIGAFAEWGIPLLATSGQSLPLVDYSALESRRSAGGLILIPDNRQQLDQLLQVNSLLCSQYVSHASPLSITRLTAGIRLTILLQTTSTRGCMCLSY